MAISLGDINFGLGPDTSRLQSAMSQVLQFGRAVSNAAKSQADGARQAEAAMRRQEAAILSALQSTMKLGDAIRATGGNGNLINQSTAAFTRLTRELANGQATALQYQRAMEDFRATTNRVQRALDGIETGLNANVQAQKQAAAAARAHEQALMSQGRIIFNAEQQVLRYNAALKQLSSSSQQKLAAQFNPQAALNQLQSTISAPNTSARAAQEAVQQFTAGLNAARIAAKELQGTGLPGLFNSIAQNSMLLFGPLSGVAFRLQLVAQMVEHLGAAWATGIAGAAAMGFGLFKLGEAAIDAQKKMQQIQLTMDGVSGSAVLTKDNLDFLRGVATRAGTDFVTTANAFAKLEAASKGTSLEGTKTRTIFEQMVLVNQKLGRSTADLEGVLLALEQIMSKGQVMAQELHLQLGNRLPGAMQIMAAALGVTTKEVNRMMAAGELSIDVLARFAEAAAKRFGVELGDKINTTAAAEANLKTAMLNFNIEVDKAIGFSRAYVSVLESLTGGFNSLAGQMNLARPIAGALAIAITLIFAPTIIGGAIALGNAIRTATAAMLAFNAATVANPIGAFATILLRVGVALAGAVIGFKLLDDAVNGSNDSLVASEKSIKDYIKAQTDMKSLVIDTAKEKIKESQAFISAIEGQITAQEELIARQKAGGGVDMLTGLSFGGGDVNESISKLDRLRAKYKDAQADFEQLQKILADVQKKVASQSAANEFTTSQENAVKRLTEHIDDLANKVTTLQMPPGFGREQLRITQEVEKEVASARLELERAFGGKVPDNLLVGLDMLRERFERLKNLEFADKLRKNLDSVNEKIQEANDKFDQMFMSPGQKKFAEAWADIDHQVRQVARSMQEAGQPADVIANRIEQLRTSLTRLKTREIQESLTIPLKNANDTITETQQKLRALYMTPGAREVYEAQIQVNKAVNDYHDQLVRAGVPLDQVVSLTNKFADAMARVKSAELQLKNFPTVFQKLSDIFSSGLDSAVDNFVEAIKQGQSVAEAFRTTWINVLGDIMKEFLKLSVTNPLKNLLFGSNAPVLGGLGNASSGGLLGGLFGGTSTLRNPFTATGGWGLGLPGGGATGVMSISAPIVNVTQGLGAGVGGISSGVGGLTGSWPSYGMLPWPGASTGGNEFEAARNAIRMIESGSFGGNYGLVSKSGALGAYQVMPSSLADWGPKVFGQQVSPQQFLQNPGMQDQLFNSQFGGYVNRYGYEGASRAWFGGPGGMNNMGATDMFGTSVGGYGNKFSKLMEDQLKGMSDGMEKVTTGLTDMGAQIPETSTNLVNSLTQSGNAAQTLATQGIVPAEAAMTQYAGTTLTSAAEQQAVTTASVTTLGTSSATAAAEVSTLGSAAATSGASSGLSGLGGVASGGFLGLLGFALGGVFSRGRLQHFATGDIFSRPTHFAFGGGVGEMGEAGPEAVMPLVRDSGGRLGVKAHGSDDGGFSGAIKDLKDAIMAKQQGVRVVNTFDGAGFLSEALASREGEATLLNFVRSRRSAFKQAMS